MGLTCAKSGLFSKATVSVRVRVRGRVSFSRCEMTTFDEPDGVHGGKVIQEEFLEKVLGPKCAKSGLFAKARVSVRPVRVRVRVSFSRCQMTTFDEPDGVQG